MKTVLLPFVFGIAFACLAAFLIVYTGWWPIPATTAPSMLETAVGGIALHAAGPRQAPPAVTGAWKQNR